MKVVVLVPTYNERENIESLISKIGEVISKLPGRTFSILIVDDNSPDGTARVVRKIAERDRKVKLLLRKKKEGLGAAYLAGMRYAFLRMDADVVITMDADFSHSPSYIPEFLKQLENGADFIVGSRYIKGGSIASGWSQHRKFLSIFGNWITRLLLLNSQLHDWTSGYRAIRKSIFSRVVSSISEFQGYTFNISFAYFALQNGARIAEIPIRFVDRTKGKSKLGFEYLYNTPVFLIKTRLKKLFHVV